MFLCTKCKVQKTLIIYCVYNRTYGCEFKIQNSVLSAKVRGEKGQTVVT